ncbi:Os05g0524525 [Oryza sativa Japonica Group]|uniref:Os05g0524525 protein n=1 Tax=Oryza sativa subsp. japonica TaxID=39947 RepID=A0A0P0WQ61_ORYSJ|nr:hypothetical protein EE612_030712 [Oryza sativa]BAS94971.1 Os05g0524525 [Oryza sativa Japonica Group]
MAMYPGVGSLGSGTGSQENSMFLEAFRGVIAVCITAVGVSYMSLSRSCTFFVDDIWLHLVESTHGNHILSCGSSGYLQQCVIGRAEVEPAEEDKALRGVRLRVERVLERPQVQPGDERRPGAGVHQADLHEVIRHDDDGLHDHRVAGARDVHHRPVVDADVEIKHG